MSRIHPTAIIDPSAALGEAVAIGPYAIVEAEAIIGDHCCVGAHAVIKRYTHLGSRNQIHEHAVIGGDPQDLSFRSCISHVVVGDDNVIREGVTLHRATRAGNATRIGNHNFFMAYAHVAHDCTVGDKIVLANGAALGGHVSVGDQAFISAFAAVHQFCRIGRLTMVSGLAGVNLDCLPFIRVTGAPARACGLNLVGLKRAGFAADEIRQLKQAYRLVLCSGGLSLREALAELSGSPSASVKEWVHFIEGSSRGFAHHRP